MRRLAAVAFVLTVVAAIAFGAATFAKGKPAPGECNKNILCLDVWDPVICKDGKIYSNACYAKRACAKGCVPTGGGPVPL